MTCSNCGTDNPAGAVFCGGCGRALSAPPTAPTPPVPPPTAPTPPIPPVPPVPPAGSSDPTLVGGLPPSPPPPPDSTTAFAAPPPAKKKTRRSLLLGLLALLVVAGLVGSYLVFGSDDEGDTGQIVLEPIGQSLEDDFAGNLDLRRFDSSLENVLPGAPLIGSGIASALSARRADGDTPGLYGGSRDVGTCDVEQLVDFLTDDANADKAEAWAETLGIEVDEIEDFVAELTPLRLRFDTRVTNHGFTDGEANGFQSVLEAGTAVLVDDKGIPRVKCNCGNPLAEHAELAGLDEDDALDAEALVQNLDDAWEAFDPDDIAIVEPGDAVEEFVLVDIDTGELFTRPAGTDGDQDGDVDLDEVCDLLGDSPTCQEPPDETTTTTTTTTEVGEETTTSTTEVLGTGDVQVTLRWDSNADLDLVVIDPNGEEASRGSSTSTGGRLDVDSNVSCVNDGSVENVFWPEGQAPPGAYTIIVQGFQVGTPECGEGDYEITVETTSQAPQTFTGSVGQDEESTHTFRVG